MGQTNSYNNFAAHDVDISGPPANCIKAPLSGAEVVHDDDSTSHLVMKESRLWNTKILKVYFINKSDEKLNEEVLTIAKTWEKYVSIKFELAQDTAEANIRIDYIQGGGNWSYVGNVPFIKTMPKLQTMNLGSLDKDSSLEEKRRAVLHEFGHALGFEHELQHPGEQIQWDIKSVFAFYLMTAGWDAKKTSQQVLTKLDSTRDKLLGSSYLDKKSIMCYQVNPRFIKLEYRHKYGQIGLNTSLSETDQFEARRAYPLSLNYFPLKSRPSLKRDDVHNQFIITRRPDYDPNIIQYSGQACEVVGVHPVNGVQVKFNTGFIVWVEPECLIPDQSVQPDPKSSKTEIKRLYVGTTVEIEDKSLNDRGIKQGIVFLNKPSDFKAGQDGYKKVTVLCGNEIQKIEIPKLIRAYLGNMKTQTTNELSYFKVKEKYVLQNQQCIEESMIRANRATDLQDYGEIFEKLFRRTRQNFLIQRRHVTNGLEIMVDGTLFWLEPDCFEPIIVPSSVEQLTRYFVGTQRNGGYVVMHQNPTKEQEIAVKDSTDNINNIDVSNILPIQYDAPDENLLNVQEGAGDSQESVKIEEHEEEYIHDDFVQTFAEQVFGLDQNNTFLVCSAKNKLDLSNLHIVDPITEDKVAQQENLKNFLSGRYSAKPKNQTFVRFNEIKPALQQVFSQSQDQEETIKVDTQLIKYQYKQLIENTTLCYFLQGKYAENKNDFALEYLKSIQDKLKLITKQMQKTLNAYSSQTMLSILRELYLDNVNENDVKVTPEDYLTILTDYEKQQYASYFRPIEFTYEFNANEDLSSFKSELTKFRQNVAENETNLADYFNSVSITADIFEGQIERQFFNEAMFGLQNFAIPGSPMGLLSNGDDFSTLDGLLSLIPNKFIVTKNVQVTFEDINPKLAGKKLDNSLFAINEMFLGPFKILKQNVEYDASQKGTSRLVFKIPETQILGCVCKKMELCPTIDSPQPAHLFGWIKAQAKKVANKVLPAVQNVLKNTDWMQVGKATFQFLTAEDGPTIQYDINTKTILLQDSTFTFTPLDKIDKNNRPLLQKTSSVLTEIKKLQDAIGKVDESKPKKTVTSQNKLRTQRYGRDETNQIKSEILKEGLILDTDAESSIDEDSYYFMSPKGQVLTFAFNKDPSKIILNCSKIKKGEQIKGDVIKDLNIKLEACAQFSELSDKVQQVVDILLQRNEVEEVETFKFEPLNDRDNATGITYDYLEIDGHFVPTKVQFKCTKKKIRPVGQRQEPDYDAKKADKNYRGYIIGGDNHGHLIASKLGGSGEEWNIVPINESLNKGIMKMQEKAIQDYVETNNEEVNIIVTCHYEDKIVYEDDNGVKKTVQSRRPSHIHYYCKLGKITFNQLWKNSDPYTWRKTPMKGKIGILGKKTQRNGK